MLSYLIKRPMLLTSIGCCIISVIAFYSEKTLLLLTFAIPVLTVFLICFKTDVRLIVTSVLIFAMCIVSGTEIAKINNILKQSGTEQRAELIICDINYKGDKYYTATAEICKSDRLDKGVKLNVFFSPYNLKSGQHILADVKLENLTKDIYYKDSISKEIYLKGSLGNITVLEGKTDKVLAAAESIRTFINDALNENMEYSKAATMCALLYGEKDYFEEDFYMDVRGAGVSHIMVVSGMHLAIIVTFFTKLSRKLFNSKRIKFFIIIIVVSLITLVCGFTMSILRAGITYILQAFAILFDRKGKPENTLGGAVTIILFNSPFAILSLAFQLSVLSTFGVLVVALPLLQITERKIRLCRPVKYAVSNIIITLSAQIFTLPVVIYAFGEISVLSVASNLLISFAVTCALCVVVVAMVVYLLSPFVAGFIFSVADIFTGYINAVINYIGSKSYALVKVSAYWGFVGILTIFLALIVLVACKTRRNMLKLEKLREKIIKEGGGKLKCHL